MSQQQDAAGQPGAPASIQVPQQMQAQLDQLMAGLPLQGLQQQPPPAAAPPAAPVEPAPASKKRKLEEEDGQADAEPQQQPQQRAAEPASTSGGASAGAAGAGPSTQAGGPGHMPPPQRKRSDDDAWVLPRRGVQHALKAAGLDKDFRLETGDALQGVLMELYGTLLENAVQFGCSSARARKSSALKPRDMAVYLERSWGVTVPGFSGDQVRAHRKPAVSDVHRKRLQATRQVVSATSLQAPEAVAAPAAPGQPPAAKE